MKILVAAVSGLALLAAACAEQKSAETAAADPAPSAAPEAPAVPPAVDGWREYPVRDGVISIQPAKWRTDKVEVAVPAGVGLEYKLAMKKGQGVVYNVGYANLEHPGMMVVEFHGHTDQVDGVGDLMYYSKTGGTPESGTFVAPWDGIHGWYLKNDSPKDVVAILELAGFYAIETK
jgi:hypothetical protein